MVRLSPSAGTSQRIVASGSRALSAARTSGGSAGRRWLGRDALRTRKEPTKICRGLGITRRARNGARCGRAIVSAVASVALRVILGLGEATLDALASHDLLLVRHGPAHAVGVHLRVLVGLHDGLHVSPLQTLLLGDGTVLVGEQKRLEIDNLLAELRNLRCEGIILTAKHFHLGLQVGKPLLLTLTTFQGGDTDAR